jgi:hypothetical protein
MTDIRDESKMDSTPPKYRRIYWDSNPLLKIRWPNISSDFRETAALLKMFDIKSILLESVEKELEAHWLRGVNETRGEAKRKFDNISEIATRVGIETTISLPSRDDLHAAYKKAVETTVSERNLLRRTPALRSAAELFEMAIQHRKPFGEKGKNFQDAVICLAAIDDLLASGESVGVFVSEDGGFDQETLNILAHRVGVELQLFEGIDPLLQDLKKHLMKLAHAEWETNDKQALSAVRENLPSIQEFLTAKLEIPETEGLFSKIISISEIEVTDVTKARTPSPWTMHDGDTVTVTAELELRIHAKVSRTNPWFCPPPRVLKVRGEAKPETTFTTFSHTESEEDLVKTVTVELTAVFKDYRFVELKPVSVSLKEKVALSKLKSFSGIGDGE